MSINDQRTPGPLWDTVKPALRRDARQTSREAAAAVASRVRPQAEAVLEAIRASVDGLTDQEIGAATGLAGDSIRPRRGELLNMNLIRDSGRRRTLESGRKAIVWVATSETERA